MKSPLFILASIICFSCGESSQANVVVEKASVVEEKPIQDDTDILAGFGSQLTKEWFVWTLDTAYHDSLTFKRYHDNLDEIDAITLQPHSIRTIRAKANAPLKGTDLYPRLVLQEAVFKEKIG